jgi:hypothetical protein
VNYTVTFSEVVTGVDKTDFALTTTGISGASVSSVSGSGTTYSVVVATGSGDGTLRLNVIDNDSIVDLAGNPLGGIGAGNGAFTSGQTYTITKTTPGAAALVSPLASVTTGKPTFVWSKVAGATLYRLWIKNSGGTWVVQNLYSGANICGATNCGATIATPLANGVYTWNIQTLTATKNGAWSGHSFTVAIPTPGVSTLVSPKGTIHLAKPTFIWSKDSVATLYRLWAKDSGGAWVFQNLYAGKNICGATNCAMVSPVTLANGTYTWYIDTLTATQNGQWSAQAITVSVPDVLPSSFNNEEGVTK